jgi:hypothetical protein
MLFCCRTSRLPLTPLIGAMAAASSTRIEPNWLLGAMVSRGLVELSGWLIAEVLTLWRGQRKSQLVRR